MSADKTPGKEQFYDSLIQRARHLLTTHRDCVSNTANIASLVFTEGRKAYGPAWTNWSGFYLVKQLKLQSDPNKPSHAHGEVLVLGPFHGKPAVSVIAKGKGVCGTAWKERATQLVPDVHSHPNHIACDSASASEVVVPVFSDLERKNLVALLDMDSPVVNGFDEYDASRLEELAEMIGLACDWTFICNEQAITLRQDPNDSDGACALSRG